MKESELFGKLFPGHPDLLPIIESIKEKYDIPEIEPRQDNITELILLDNPPDLDIVRQDFLERIQSNPDLLPKQLIPFYQSMKSLVNLPQDVEITEPVSDDLKNQINQL